MLRKFVFMLVAAAMVLGGSAATASAQTYPPGSTIGASISPTGALLLNTGDYVGDIVVEVNGAVIYSGPADQAANAGLTGVAPGAQVSITGMNPAGETVRSTTVAQVAVAPTPTAVPAPTAVPIVAPAPTRAPVFVVAPAPVAAPVTVAATHPVAATHTAAADTKKGTALAVTGSSTSVPVLLGTMLLAAGGLALLGSRKRQSVKG